MIAVKDVLVAIDFSETSDAALRYGRSPGPAFGATLHLLHVVDNVFMRATVADPRVVEATAWAHLSERLTDEDRRDLRAVAVIRKSDAPADEIVDYANASHIDLIVLGTHGREGLSHLLTGSVAERVVRTAPCPVLTLKHPQREFVVPDPQTSSTPA